MEQYSVIKKNEIMPFATTGMDRETVILSEVKAEKDNTIWYHSYVESKKKWHMWTYLQNRYRLTDIQNKFIVTKRERGGER